MTTHVEIYYKYDIPQLTPKEARERKQQSIPGGYT